MNEEIKENTETQEEKVVETAEADVEVTQEPSEKKTESESGSEEESESANGKSSGSSGYVKGVLTGCLIMSLIFLIVVLVYTGVLRGRSKKAATLFDSYSIMKLSALNNIMDKIYYEDVSIEDKRNGMYKGLIQSSGDPYSTYYSAEDLTKFKEDYDGVFGGIGASVSYDYDVGSCYVVEVVEGSPAEKAGVEPGDYFLSVNGESSHEKTSSELVKEIRGEIGTDVDVSFMRDGKQIDVTLTRAQIESQTVSYEKVENEDIAYIRISSFDAVTPKNFKDALASAKNDNVKGIVFDLRGNPGGSLAAVVEILGEMCPQGVVVYTEDKYGNRKDYTSDGNNTYNYPTVVLVDKGSASCSEIFAGALKDLNVATVMGTTTYGKGIVQTVYPLADGSAVKLTNSKYFTPCGKNFHGVGIDPNVEVYFDSKKYLEDRTDNQYEAAIEYVKKEINK